MQKREQPLRMWMPLRGWLPGQKKMRRHPDLQMRRSAILWNDCVKFVEREIRRGNHYDGIIMDPPSYGRGPKGEIWKIEEKIFPLVNLCTKVLSKDPLFFLINSYTTGLQPAVLSYMLELAVGKPFGGQVTADEIGLPVSSNGLVLPCGASGRFEMCDNLKQNKSTTTNVE